MLSHQFDQLKEEIEAKEAALVKESQEQVRLEKEKDELITQVEKARASAKEMAAAKSETERSHELLKDRVKLVEDDLSKARTHLEKALRERSQLDNKMALVASELESAKRKASVQVG